MRYAGRLTELKQDYEDGYFESRDNDDKMISIWWWYYENMLGYMLLWNIFHNIDELCNVSGIAATLGWQAGRTMDIDHQPTQHQDHHTHFGWGQNTRIQIQVYDIKIP